MSMHNTPLTDLEREGLSRHLLAIEYPSQLADVFRQGMAWALSKAQPTPSQSDYERAELALFKEWFQSVQGIEYQGIYTFAHDAWMACALLSKSQPTSQDADWLWLQLMDYCKHKEKAPAQDGDLFSIATRLRERQAIDKAMKDSK